MSLASDTVSGRSKPVVSGSPMANRPPMMVRTPNSRGARTSLFFVGIILLYKMMGGRSQYIKITRAQKYIIAALASPTGTIVSMESYISTLDVYRQLLRLSPTTYVLTRSPFPSQLVLIHIDSPL